MTTSIVILFVYLELERERQKTPIHASPSSHLLLLPLLLTSSSSPPSHQSHHLPPSPSFARMTQVIALQVGSLDPPDNRNLHMPGAIAVTLHTTIGSNQHRVTALGTDPPVVGVVFDRIADQVLDICVANIGSQAAGRTITESGREGALGRNFVSIHY